ncbi:MAG: YqgE/AlgH family protein [Bacteroidota bacterium]
MMKTTPRIHTQIKTEIRTGSILLAKPFWAEEAYKRSVILVISHSDEGSTGIILNKMSNLSVNDALPELDHHTPLYYGGPINKKTISYVHSNPNLPDAFYLGNDLFWGGNYDLLLELIAAGKFNPSDCRFCAGFVQWSPGELENEVNDDKWWVSELSRQELFLQAAEDLWGVKLVDDGHLYGLLNPYPDPSMN